MFYVVHGADEFTAREAVRKLLADERFANNIERFDGAAGDIQGIRQACATMPFLAEGRLVLVEGLPKPKRESAAKDAESAASETTPAKGKRGAKKPTAAAQAKEFAGALAALGEDLPETTTLAVYAPEELPKTNPLLAAAQAHGKLLTFAPPTGPALEKWIAQRAAQEGAAIAPDAAQLLATLANGQLRLLASEINKLATYVGPKGVIDRQAIARLVPDSRETRVFDLTDALARGERAAALKLLHELLAEGQAPLMIVAMVARQLRIVIQVKDLAAQGKRGGDIAAAAGLAPFLVEKTLAQARKFSMAQLEAAQRACLDVDTALKRSRMAPDLALDLFLTEFGRR